MGKKRKKSGTGQIILPNHPVQTGEGHQVRQFLKDVKSLPTQAVPPTITTEVLQNAPSSSEKSKKVVTTKTFTKGMMDISLLTSNATQLRSVMVDPDHQFRDILLWLIILSIVLQVTSTLLMILADFFKSNSDKDDSSRAIRKRLSFGSMGAVSLVTAVNVFISAFFVPPNKPTH